MANSASDDAHERAEKPLPSRFISFPCGELAPPVCKEPHVKLRDIKLLQDLSPFRVKTLPLCNRSNVSGDDQNSSFIWRPAFVKIRGKHGHAFRRIKRTKPYDSAKMLDYGIRIPSIRRIGKGGRRSAGGEHSLLSARFNAVLGHYRRKRRIRRAAAGFQLSYPQR